ncbi:MAG: D-alanyl-D-alanine carboxypeptidase [Haliscomenobacter sp.]|nr:D-alanyl-D-alanine carboxypeptidase [Haliscomenobacter sp.]
MQESDNYLAEQLLLMCSAKLSDTLNTEAVIEYAKKNLFQGLPPDTLNWADGSGLSRYNLFTPRTIVALLHKLYQEVPQERLFRILATGGKSGTIRSWYGGKAEPYVFAKTGTLANQHCLSGFVKTKKGRTLIFSFMHNNFNGSATPIRTEMQNVLEWIWESL